MAQAQGKPVVVGGPDAMSSPEVFEHADFLVLGEAEGIIEQFVEAWEAGERAGRFEAVKFKVDITTSPIPRFDLLDFSHYLFVGVQFSRGCPFNCEFCDIIELFGRVPRSKTIPQMLAELQALYDAGYRGHVDFVDDNFIGNKKAMKKFLPALEAWQKSTGYPFMFSTEASINLADDAELLDMMRRANFFAVFVGIESPGYRHADLDAQEAEHAPQPGRERPQDPRGRDDGDRGLHRRLRYRGAPCRRSDGRLHRGHQHSGLHGRPADRVADDAADPPPGERRPPAALRTWRKAISARRG